MTEEAQRIAIAETCGWTECHAPGAPGLLLGKPPNEWKNNHDPYTFSGLYEIPNFPGDLDAMHEVEMTHSPEMGRYAVVLQEIVKPANLEGPGTIYLIRATAAQRAEAFLKTLNLWTE